MAERDSWAVMNGSTRVVDAEDARIALGALWAPGTGVGTPRAGIVPGPVDGGKVAATSPTPGSTVTVQPFPAVIPASRGLGPYVATLDGVKTLPILDVPADPSNQRNDLIIAQQSDTYYADNASGYTVRRVLGNAAAAPQDPPVTGSPDYLLLARVRVTAGATQVTDAMIDDLRPPWTVAVGGIIPVTGRIQRDAIPSPYPGMSVYRRDKNWIETRSLTAWRSPDLVKTSALADITDPLTGQLALLTTDSQLYTWTGSAWALYGRGPIGRVASASFPAVGPAAIGATETVCDTISFTSPGGRRYKMTWDMTWVASAAGYTSMRFLWATGSAPANLIPSNNQFHQKPLSPASPGNWENATFVSEVASVPAGTVIFGTTWQRTAGTGTTDIRGGIRKLIVEDIGV